VTGIIDWGDALFYAGCSLLEDLAYGIQTGRDEDLGAGG
jgi:hypothetical protein